jgi:hypothetical protein
MNASFWGVYFPYLQVLRYDFARQNNVLSASAVLHGSGGVLVYETGTESFSWLFNGEGWERGNQLLTERPHGFGMMQIW